MSVMVTDQELQDELIELLSSEHEIAVIENRCNRIALEQAMRLAAARKNARMTEVWTLVHTDEDGLEVLPQFWAPSSKYGEHSLVAFDVAHGGWCIPSFGRDSQTYMTPAEAIAHAQEANSEIYR